MPPKPKPNGYKESDGTVTLTMTQADYGELLFMMGYATAKSTPERINRWFQLINRINQGNPHFKPYATT